MRHRLLLAFNVAALVALVPVAILWVRTELTNDLIVLTGRYTTVYQISTSPSRVQAAWGEVNSPPAEPSWHHGDIPSTAAALPRTAIDGDWRTLGVGAATARPAGASAPIQLLSIPLAPIAAILLALPVLTALASIRHRLLARRRLSRGLCPSCGHNLKGSNYHCPTCGERVPTTMAMAAPAHG